MGIKALVRPFAARENRRHLVIMALLLVVCVVAFTLLGAYTLPAAGTVYKHEIITEDADELTDSLYEGEELLQMLFVQGPLYGVSLRVSTGGRALSGTLEVALEEHYRTETLLRSELSLSAIEDGAWQDFPFDGVVDGGAGTWYTLRITARPDTPGDAPAFHKSEGIPDYYYDENLSTSHYSFLDNFVLIQHGEMVQEMLTTQYLIDVSGNFLVGPYCFFASLLTVLVLALYALLFLWRLPLHQVFALAALGLGLVFLFLIPPRAAPDEYAHISNAYHYSNLVLGTAWGDEYGTTWLRAGDEMKLHNYDTTSVGIFAWRDLAQSLLARAPAGEGGLGLSRSGWVFPLQLLAPTAGVVLARLLGLGRVGLLLLGRLFNLIFYTAVGSRAIKRMPLARPLLFCVGLLPMSLQLAGSFSYDTFVLAVGMYLLACCLDYRCNKKPVGWRQMALLAVLCLLLAPAKAVYVPMLALLFLVKPEQFASTRVCWMARGGILAGGLALWLVFTFTSLAVSVMGAPTAAVVSTGVAAPTPALVQTMAREYPALPHNTAVPAQKGDTDLVEDYKGEVRPNGDAVQLYDAGYILQHIPAAAKILLRTVWEQGPLWVQGLVGGRLGESIAVDIEVSWALVAGLLVLLFLSALPGGEDSRVLLPRHRAGFLGISLLCAGAVVLAGLTWTPVNYLTVFGIQGRYLLPVLPLILLALRGRELRFVRPTGRGLAFAAVLLLVAVQAQAFAAILQLPA